MWAAAATALRKSWPMAAIRFAPPGVFERLGIEMTNAIVRNARAKLIERRFEDVKNYISRPFYNLYGRKRHRETHPAEKRAEKRRHSH